VDVALPVAMHLHLLYVGNKIQIWLRWAHEGHGVVKCQS
jgi:hypothetical protein